MLTTQSDIMLTLKPEHELHVPIGMDSIEYRMIEDIGGHCRQVDPDDIHIEGLPSCRYMKLNSVL